MLLTSPKINSNPSDELIKVKPQRVRFLLTYHCNAKCSYCHNEGQSVPTSSRINPEFVDQFLEMVSPPQEVVLSGGEPTLNPNVVDIAKVIKDKGIYLSMNTNGSHSDRLKQLFPFLDEIKFNMDSMNKETYESIKHLSFERTLNNVIAAKEAGIYTKINTPFTSIDNALELINFSAQTGVDLKFIEVLEPGAFSDPSLEISQLEAVLNQSGYSLTSGMMKNIWRKGNSLIITMRCFCRAAVLTGNIDDSKALCRQHTDLYITPDGSIKPCIYQPFSISIYNAVISKNGEILRQKLDEFDQHFGYGICQDMIRNSPKNSS